MSMDVRKVKLDFNKTFQSDIPSVQGDTGRSIEFQIMDGSVAKNITGEAIKIFGKKPDGFRVFNNAVITDAEAGKCTVDLTEQMLCVAGTVQCTLVRYKNNQRLSSKKFNITISETVADDIEIESTSEYLALTEALNITAENINTSVNSVIDEMLSNGDLANMTIEDNSIDSTKYKDDSVTPAKVSFLEKKLGKNLFNANSSDNKEGVKLTSNGGLSNDSSLLLSHLIPVEAGKYILSYSTGSHYLSIRTYSDEGTTQVRAFAYQNYSASNIVITVAENEKYIRFNCTIADKSKVQLEKGETKTGYEPYVEPKYGLDSSMVEYTDTEKAEEIAKKVMDTYEIKDHSLSPIKYCDITNNLLTELSYQVGMTFKDNTGALKPNGSMITTDYIPLVGSTVVIKDLISMLTTSIWGYYQLANSNKTTFGNITRFDGNSTLTVDNAAYSYIRISFSITEEKLKNMYIGYDKKYIEQGYKLNDNIIPKKSNWNGKTLCAYGDSNTGNKMWQDYVLKHFGMGYVHLGIGGTTAVGRCTDVSLAKIPNNIDVFTLMFGTNDISQGVPLGQLPEFGVDKNYAWDTTTYIGALCKIIKYVSTNIPKCRIILIAPLYRANAKLNATANEYANFDKYIKACRDIAERFGCEFINMYQELGANMWNYGNYFLDESDNGDGDCWSVHLNAEGGKRFARKVINKMNEIEPIE